MKSLTLIKVRNPFNRRDRDVTAVPYKHGQTLLDLRQAHFPVDIDVTVSVNGTVIPSDQLALSYPLAGNEIIFVPGLHGGGSNEKNIYRTVLMIAVVVVAAYTQQWYLTAYGGWAGALLAAAAVSIAGGMLINAVLPPPRPKIPELNAPAYSGSQLYSWSPQTLQQQGLPLPAFYGRNKLYGNIIDAYTSNNDSDSKLNILISLGLGPQKQLSTFQINDQAIENFGIQPEVRLGDLRQSVTMVGRNTATEHTQSVRFETTSPYTFITPGDAFDRLEVEVLFPGGLWHLSDSGAMDSNGVQIKISARKVGDTLWTYLTNSWGGPAIRNTTPGYWSLGYWSDDLQPVATTYVSSGVTTGSVAARQIRPASRVWVEWTRGDGNPTAWNEGTKVAVDMDGDLTNDHYCYWHWFDDPTASVSTLDTFYIFSASSTKPIRKTFGMDVFSSGAHEIKVENLMPTKDDARYGEAVYVTAVREIVFDGFQYPRQALVGLSALASDKLSGSFRFSCITEGKLCLIWDGTRLLVDRALTISNPAWVTLDILAQPVFDNNLQLMRYDGINPSQLDLVRWKEWADWCDELVPNGSGGYEKRITFNGGFDTAGNMWDAAHRVAEIGRAAIVQRGTGYTVIVDKPATAVQLFTVGNINQSSFKETWLSTAELASEIQIDFINADKDYTRDMLLITNPDATPGSSPANMQLFGVTRASEVWRHGRYRLACNQYIRSTAEWEADIDAITCELGEVVNVQHDIPTAGSVGGRLVTAASGTVDLDQEITIEAGKTYSIWVRTGADQIQIRTVTNAPGSYVHLTVATPFSAVPVKYDIYAFGEADKIVKPYRILGMKRARDLQVRLVGVEYNESVYLTDYMQPALPTPNYSSLDPYPPVTDIKLSEVLLAAQDGTLLDMLDVSFTVPIAGQYRSAEVWYAFEGGSWMFGGATESDRMRIPVLPFKTYTIAVYTINVLGNKMSGWKAPTETISTLGKMMPPSDVTNFAAVQNGKDILFSWTHVPDADKWAYEIRQGLTWASSRPIVSQETSDRRTWPAELNATYRFLIKAIDSSGNYSVNATAVDITLTGIDETLNIILSQDEITKGGGPDGTKTNFVFVAAATPFVTMPHMLTNTDVSGYTNEHADIINYKGDITLAAEYITLVIDTFKIGDTWTRILDTSEAYDSVATDQSYPDRTNLTYPLDTNTHITMPVVPVKYICYSDDNATWSAWELYAGTVQKKFRYVKIKFDVNIASNTGIFKLFSLALTFDVPDINFLIQNFAVAAGAGANISYAAYGLSFYATPTVWAQLVGGTGINVVPDISAKTATGCHIDGINRLDAKVASVFDVHIKGY